MRKTSEHLPRFPGTTKRNSHTEKHTKASSCVENVKDCAEITKIIQRVKISVLLNN